MIPRILVVDDQVSFCHHIQAILEAETYSVDIADGGKEAIGLLTSGSYDILLTDMKMPRIEGLELIKVARKLIPGISCVIMTGYGTIASAVNSIKDGVSDYLEKPFEPETLLIVIERIIRERKMLQEIRDLRKEVSHRYSFGNMIGKSQKMQNIYDLIQRVAATDARVFITGETGVGKELVAKAIHFNSARKNKPFVSINCGALAESLLESELFGHEEGAFTGAIHKKAGKFEYARGGTFFLDEAGDISPRMQVKLLRVLQEKKMERVGGNKSIDVDVRLLSATNRDIKKKIQEGKFRSDLYYRLNVVPIDIPPLRERIEDIPLLVKHFTPIYNRALNTNIQEFSVTAMNQLIKYHWPGNVRELENIIERAFVVAEGDKIDTVMFTHSPHDIAVEDRSYNVDIDIPFATARSVALTRFEKAYLFEALKRYQGNVSRIARETEINPRTIWRKLKSYGLDNTRFK
ncbi:MAG: sigma-54-dependent Fis family transcriptional regulator [Nitrospina sp.]|jgi:DNA-binding NtrC family response regulator|nr:sigma-54-dependent Fis family transcriptional regulator [Nitrospina sp.]